MGSTSTHRIPAYRVMRLLAALQAALGVALIALPLQAYASGMAHTQNARIAITAAGALILLVGLVGPLRIAQKRLKLPVEIQQTITVQATFLPAAGLLLGMSGVSPSLPVQAAGIGLVGAAALLAAYAGFFSLSRRLPPTFYIGEMLSIVRSAGILGSAEDSAAHREFMRWSEGRVEGVAEGQPAPDGPVVTLAGDTTPLSTLLRGDQPVVLNFGSYSCPHFRKRIDELHGLVERWLPKGVRFLMVYTAEAHPEDGWSLPGQYEADAEFSEESDFCFQYAASIDDRRSMARRLVEAKDLQMEVVLDEMDDGLLKAYNSWPIRLYVIQHGRVVFSGQQGPFGYDIDAVDALFRQART